LEHNEVGANDTFAKTWTLPAPMGSLCSAVRQCRLSIHGLRMPAVTSERSAGENQVDLVEIWGILVRRRYWILGAVLLAVALATAYVVLTAPVFESRAKIEIGQVSALDEPMAFEPAEVLATRLLARYGPIAPDASLRPHPHLTQASLEKGTSAVIELVAQGDAREDPADLLKTIYREVSEAHREIYERNLGALKDRLRQLDDQRGELRLHLQEMTNLLDALKARDPVQASLLMLERGRVLMSLGDLEAQRPRLVQHLAEPLSRPTRLLNEIAGSAEPSEPRRAAAFMLALVVGLVAGILFALFVEFLAYVESAAAR
jgi:uncharacterized protein involved in exopolysaccharide biosynthesis